MLKGFIWTIVGILLLAVAVPCLLYVPWVQDIVVPIALKQVNKSSGLTIEVGKFRLRWPLRVTIDEATILEASGDTMLRAGSLYAQVQIAPLLHGHIMADELRLERGMYRMGNQDSIMQLRADIRKAVLTQARVDLKGGEIDLRRGMVDGAKVRLCMLDSTAPPTPVDTSATKWVIRAGEIELRNVDYGMQMLPIIDQLTCRVPLARLVKGEVNMRTRRIHATSLAVDSVSARYLTPSAQYLASYVPKPVPPTTPWREDEMWEITADSLHLSGRDALYAMAGAKPMPGFDMNYIAATDIDIAVDNFRNRGPEISVPLRRIAATERCGLALEASGIFEMKGEEMRARDFVISTPRSLLSFNAMMGMGDMATDPDVPIQLLANAQISPRDIGLVFPAFTPMLKAFTAPLEAKVDIDGSPSALNIYGIDLAMPGMMKLKAQGMVENVLDAKKLQGQVSIDGDLRQQLFRLPLVAALLPCAVPTMTLHGDIDYSPQAIQGDIKVNTLGGELAAEGSYTSTDEGYDATLTLDRFPVDAFMPQLGVGAVTAQLAAQGQGFNPLSPRTHIDASVQLEEIEYKEERIGDIDLELSMHDGEASGRLDSRNSEADAMVDLVASLRNDTIDYDILAQVRHLDLQALHMSQTLNEGHVGFSSQGSVVLKGGELKAVDATGQVDNLFWEMPDLTLQTDTVGAAFVTCDTLTRASVASGDFDLRLSAPMRLTTLMDRLTASAERADRQMKKMSIDIDSLQATFPQMDMTLSLGPGNPISAMLREKAKIEFQYARMSLHNDSLISFNASVSSLFTDKMQIDSLSIEAIQHGKFLVYKAMMDNQPGTMDEFANVVLNGYLSAERVSAFMRQQNIKGETGFALGATIGIVDSVATLKFVPYNPTIAYKKWTLNDDNFVSYDLVTHRLRADLALENDKSYLKLFTVAPQDTAAQYEDVVLQVSKMHIQDWLMVSPFAPPMTGDLSADMRFAWNGKDLTGRGVLGLADFCYDNQKVGSFDLDAAVTRQTGGALQADLTLLVDSVKTITAHGAINDSTSLNPFLLDFSMVKFPLKVANPFLPAGTAKLSGTLNGTMKITRDGIKPIFDGYMQFEDAAARVTMLGTDFKFGSTKIPVDSNVVSFDNFNILACNDNPLTINGTVDMRSLANPTVDLDFNAQNMQIVNSNRARGADVYGKAYIDLRAGIQGNMRRMDVEAEATVVEGTNVTYLMPDATAALTQRSNSDMVRFVQFADTTEVLDADTINTTGMALNVQAALIIRPNTTFTVDLSSDGTNRVQVSGSGELDYSMSSLNGDRLTGRYTITSGFGRYNVPMLGEKRFDFREGSYVAFNGDMMNPILNVTADDILKANVTQEGQNSRLINFDIELSVTGTLAAMNVAFDLSTQDDITIENQLQSMTAEQRASQAMNLLLTNVYTGIGTSATGNLAGNPLYSFLEGRLNSWIANNVRGVDITFGIDQYKSVYEGTSTTATSYSYQVSKTLFDDRVKIVVGGNYTTDANTDEDYSQNLINDISFEYMLNRAGSMYVRLFRHTGYISILEGEVTQTGVGFVLKRSINSLRDLFRFGWGRKPKIPDAKPADKEQTNTLANSEDLKATIRKEDQL